MSDGRAPGASPALAPYWLDQPAVQGSALGGEVRCDLAIVGGGFTGLWSALKARERFPDADIVLLEARTLGNAASGRNGGFCAPSISHGVSNAMARWPKEAETLIRLGRDNLDEMAQDIETLGLDCDFERSGKLNLAATPWQKDALRTMQAGYAKAGIVTDWLEGDALKARLDSPKYSAGLFEPDYALVHPGKLVGELARICRKRDVLLYEQTSVIGMSTAKGGVLLTTASGAVNAGQVILATNAAPPLLRRLRPMIVPIFDYSLMTEPLTQSQLADIGWQGRYGIADSGNQFQYSRKTADNRILWGGYDAVYHYGSRRDETLCDRPESFERLRANFFEAFPTLAGIEFSNAWGGVIDTSARLTFFAGSALQGRLAYALGFTGQGVTASRFAALTMLDLLQGTQTERTRLRMVRRRPVPFPPEPLRSMAIHWAQRDLAREDQTGKRSLFLRSLDRLGIGFGS